MNWSTSWKHYAHIAENNSNNIKSKINVKRRNTLTNIWWKKTQLPFLRKQCTAHWRHKNQATDTTQKWNSIQQVLQQSLYLWNCTHDSISNQTFRLVQTAICIQLTGALVGKYWLTVSQQLTLSEAQWIKCKSSNLDWDTNC